MMEKLFGSKRACASVLLVMSLLAGMAAAEPLGVQAEEVQAVTEPAPQSVTDIREYDKNELLVIYKQKGEESNVWEGAEKKLTDNCSLIEVDTKKELRQLIASLEEDEDVGYIQPNYLYRTLYTNDTYSDRQWAYYGSVNINMEKAWGKGSGLNAEVIVGIIDVGVDYRQEELAGAMWVNRQEIAGDGIDNDGNGYADDIHGWNFLDGNGEICDYACSEKGRAYVEDHGTHIAGIIAAGADNGKGIAGIAAYNNVKIISAKVMGDKKDGNGISGNTSDIISAIGYIEENGASICNLSLGYEGKDMALYTAMENSSMLFVCAAGNGMSSTKGAGWDIDKRPLYPAAFELDNIISVGNMNSMGIVDYSSCYGSKSVDIAAPGMDIASAGVNDPDTGEARYIEMSGTSMSAPMVTGVAALVASYYGGNLTGIKLREAILEGAAVNPALAGKVSGNRMLDAEGALDYYKGKLFVSTEVTEVSQTSNNRRVTARITAADNKVVKAAYAKGEEMASYFAGGTEGTLLSYDGGSVSFKVRETGAYTIYLLCEDGTETTSQVKVEVPTVERLSLSATEKTLKKGKTYNLKATVTPDDMYVKLVYKTGDSKVAAVNSSGKITAKKKGKAKIAVYAKDGNTMKKAVCTVTVTD